MKSKELKLVKIFQETKYTPDTSLEKNIWHVIVAKDRSATKFKLWAFSLVGLGSCIGLIPVFKILYTDLGQSGFFEYVSLGFSGSFFSYWREISLSILESLPVTSILLSLTVFFIFFLSLTHVVKQFNNKLSLTY